MLIRRRAVGVGSANIVDGVDDSIFTAVLKMASFPSDTLSEFALNDVPLPYEVIEDANVFLLELALKNDPFSSSDVIEETADGWKETVLSDEAAFFDFLGESAISCLLSAREGDDEDC